MKYTVRDCNASGVRLASALGIAVFPYNDTTRDIARRLQVPLADFTKDAGGRVVGASEDCLVLDYAACYGGACVELMHKGRTGHAQPFGSGRLPPAAFVRAVGMMCDALRFRERVEASRL